MKIHQVGPELLHTDGETFRQTDRQKQTRRSYQLLFAVFRTLFNPLRTKRRLLYLKDPVCTAQ